jgi:hypothetical protein
MHAYVHSFFIAFPTTYTYKYLLLFSAAYISTEDRSYISLPVPLVLPISLCIIYVIHIRAPALPISVYFSLFWRSPRREFPLSFSRAFTQYRHGADEVAVALENTSQALTICTGTQAFLNQVSIT